MLNRSSLFLVIAFMGPALLMSASAEDVYTTPRGSGGWVRVLTADIGVNSFSGLELVNGVWTQEMANFVYTDETLFTQERPAAFSEIKVGDQVKIRLNEDGTPEVVSITLPMDQPRRMKGAIQVLGVVEAIEGRTLKIDAGEPMDIAIPEDAEVRIAKKVSPGEVLQRRNQVWVTRTYGDPKQANMVEKFAD